MPTAIPLPAYAQAELEKQSMVASLLSNIIETHQQLKDRNEAVTAEMVWARDTLSMALQAKAELAEEPMRSI